MERVLVIVKPNSARCHLVGGIIQRFEAKGPTVAEMKSETMTPESAREHYQHLTERSFFDELTDYMTSGPAVYLVLVGEEVIDIIHKMVGAIKAVDAVPGAARGDYVLPGTENIIHASDSRDTAVKEIARFFPPFDVNRPLEKVAK